MNIFWDVNIQCDREIKARKLDIVVVDKNVRSCTIIDIAIPGVIRASKKKEGKNWEIPATKERNRMNVQH